nr:MAG TPA: hypothetical protein [Bacteriophage sp.]
MWKQCTQKNICIQYTFLYFIDCACFINVCYGRLDTHYNGGGA